MSLRFVNSLSLTRLYQYSIHILMLCVIYQKHNCSLVTYWHSIPSFECFYYEREHNSSYLLSLRTNCKQGSFMEKGLLFSFKYTLKVLQYVYFCLSNNLFTNIVMSMKIFHENGYNGNSYLPRTFLSRFGFSINLQSKIFLL